ncbi:DNA polymerase [Puccinia sorghi]|uniref:DNA polymerase n=1 Tax=Puccinia sorghi TaxID=27349 RepID=A0A0L6UAJ5_9BASI|nr:DNA polymerase [Puccinia sorghi]
MACEHHNPPHSDCLVAPLPSVEKGRASLDHYRCTERQCGDQATFGRGLFKGALWSWHSDAYLTQRLMDKWMSGLSKPLMQIFEPILGDKSGLAEPTSHAPLVLGDHTGSSLLPRDGLIKRTETCLGCRVPLGQTTIDKNSTVCKNSRFKTVALYSKQMAFTRGSENTFARLSATSKSSQQDASTQFHLTDLEMMGLAMPLVSPSRNIETTTNHRTGRQSRLLAPLYLAGPTHQLINAANSQSVLLARVIPRVASLTNNKAGFFGHVWPMLRFLGPFGHMHMGVFHEFVTLNAAAVHTPSNKTQDGPRWN